MSCVNWPLSTLCLVLLVAGVLAFGMSLFLRVGMVFGVKSDPAQSKSLATQAMATVFDLLKESKQANPVQRYTVPRPFSGAGDAVGFTLKVLESATYLVLPEDQGILQLVHQQADGNAKQCLMYHPAIQVGSCQLAWSTAHK